MWNKDEINRAIELAKDGKTYDEIGKILNKSGHSIKCKFLKNGIKITDFKEIKKYKVIKCLNCGHDVVGGDRKFCDQSCAAIYNNKKRDKKIFEKISISLKSPKNKKIYYCINCGKELKGKNTKYCNSKCNGEYLRKISIEKWKNGEIEGNTSSKIKPFLREYLFKKYNNKCAKCGWGEKNEFTGKIPLEVEHIDGNSENNKEENLTLLCPCCHSLTKTYKGANRGNGRYNRMIRYRNGKSF